MVASGVLKIHLVPTKKACYSYIIMDMQLVGITSWLQMIQFQLNAGPPEVILMEATVNLLVPKKSFGDLFSKFWKIFENPFFAITVAPHKKFASAHPGKQTVIFT